MACSESTRNLWRLRLNWFIVLLLSPVLYSFSYVGVLSSFHRFVTDPRNETVENNKTVEGGLGESELFYSLAIAAQNFGSVLGSLSSGILVRYVPVLYLFSNAVCLHIVGYVLYGLSTRGWMLIIAELLAGFYLGAQGTLSYSYVTETCVTYEELLSKREGNIEIDKSREIRLRNLLFTLKTVGNSLGSFIGAGTAIVLAYLPVDQYRTIAWVNVGSGSLLLFSFILLFHGEYSWKKIHRCKQLCKCSSNVRSQRPGPLQIFIIMSVFLLAFIDVFKWGFFETLMNPILSDSFGFTLAESAYFYLGFSVARILGAILTTVLQRLKMKPQAIGIVAILAVISGYLVISDWQAIPYDPCTECSPYHHDLLRNMSSCLNITDSDEQVYSDETDFLKPIEGFRMTSTLFSHSNLKRAIADIQIPSVYTNFSCQLCNVCNGTHPHGLPCSYHLIDDHGKLNYTLSVPEGVSFVETFLCQQNLSSIIDEFCVNIYKSQSSSPSQNFFVIREDDYSSASNACMDASLPHHHCHWIPFSQIANKKCEDCPPICRSIEQTLSFPQFIVGMTLLVATNPLIWFPMMAIISNQTPLEMQGMLIGIFFTVSTTAQSICPIILDAMYEGFKKRTFVAAALLATLHLPFLVEIIVLYKKLGPRYAGNEPRYTKLLINADTND